MSQVIQTELFERQTVIMVVNTPAEKAKVLTTHPIVVVLVKDAPGIVVDVPVTVSVLRAKTVKRDVNKQHLGIMGHVEFYIHLMVCRAISEVHFTEACLTCTSDEIMERVKFYFPKDLVVPAVQMIQKLKVRIQVNGQSMNARVLEI